MTATCLAPRIVRAASLVLLALIADGAFAQDPGDELRSTLRRHCFDCHGKAISEARINLEEMSARPNFGRDFKDWERVVRVLRDRTMPPEDVPPPSETRRGNVVRAIEDGLTRYVAEHEGDPGTVTLRRLTSAEYSYTIKDLTGLDLKTLDGFVGDAVGGEGFTNAGAAQFMQDSTLERYLEAAKLVADHAVIGAGPLRFYGDPGRTGRELSAITRIQDIYRKHGFRTAAGEGAEPFGLDLYPRAFLVAWRYRHRDALGEPATSIDEFARREGISVRFCEHVRQVLDRKELPYPLSDLADRWRALPAPSALTREKVRDRCDELGAFLREWQSTLAASAGDEEEAAVLTAGDVNVDAKHSLTADINWAKNATSASLELAVSAASRLPATGAVVVWKNARLRFRREDGRRERPRPLTDVTTPESAPRVGFGRHPSGAKLGPGDFVIVGGASIPIVLRVPAGTLSAQLTVDVELETGRGSSEIVRCRISDGKVEGETAAEVGATSTLLADPSSPRVSAWRADVAEFARLFPEVSHREPAPSDRDPIPAPYDNAYNKPERNHFHGTIKYCRDDSFFVEHIVDDATRLELDQAWTDLLTSFEYHHANLRFLEKKYAFDLKGKDLAELDRAAIDRLPAGAREFVRSWSEEHSSMTRRLRAAEPGHVEDAIRFAGLAWRRPPTAEEATRLRTFHAELRTRGGLDHTRALRALLTRILVAPAFLYRVEPTPERSGIVALSPVQLASRLSYFIWASTPDAQLRESSATGRLASPSELESQARRMLKDPKARRLSEEFFGQWLGFYRFDKYQGIDAKRFPEFTDRLKASMYEEAVSFFEHVIREDKPVDEILFANYSFMNKDLVEHYGLGPDLRSSESFALIDGLERHDRGGLLGFGAIHAVTSAPLRTSAVRRGDWVLRRVVGTPVPPPPADAGSIPADDVLTDGLTVRRRLEAHRTDASCVNCHSRIDPLGFALERFDPIGRRRETYRDGQAIDVSGTLADGTTVTGPEGLRAYLRRERSAFHRTVAVKLLGYALGRSEAASDRPLIDKMTKDMDEGCRFSDVAARIVSSKQFLNRRVEPATDSLSSTR